MELPFYLSYKEFENRYYDNLEKWFEEYSNTSETDFLKSLAELYKPYLSYSFTEDNLQVDADIKVKNCFFPYFENFGISFCVDAENDRKAKALKAEINNISEWKTITMMEYSQHILDKINRYFQKKNLSLKENESILDHINNYEIIMSNEKTGYCINYEDHQKTIPFLKAYLPHYGCTVNISAYRSFHFSIVRIADFIDRKLKAVEAFEYTIYATLKSEAKMRLHMKNHSFLTVCN